MRIIGAILISSALLYACDKKAPTENVEPETRIYLESISLSGEDRINSVVDLHWYGTDVDGYVVGYEISYDNSNWFYVEQLDSVFNFTISAGSDTMDVEFYVRAIDNDGAVDPTPAYLMIPLKNTPPTVAFNDPLMPADTVLSVMSLTWDAEDLDGEETIDSVFIKVNQGSWYYVNPTKSFLSIIPTNTGTTGIIDGTVYFGTNDPQPQTIDGLEINDTNRVYIKVKDIAGAESSVDSSDLIYIKQQTSDLLVIGAHNTGPESFYFGILDNVYPSYDFWDFTLSSGAYQPKFWNPTFNLVLGLYDKVIMYTDDNTYPNQQTGLSQLILSSGAAAISDYVANGGKIMVSAKFPTNLDPNSALFEVMPMDSISSSAGQAFIGTDSLFVSQVVDYQDLQPSSFILGMDPFYPTADADVIFRANLETSGGWTGPDIVGARRRNVTSQVTQVFFSIELHKANGLPINMEDFFDQVLNVDFSW